MGPVRQIERVFYTGDPRGISGFEPRNLSLLTSSLPAAPAEAPFAYQDIRFLDAGTRPSKLPTAGNVALVDFLKMNSSQQIPWLFPLQSPRMDPSRYSDTFATCFSAFELPPRPFLPLDQAFID